ncbi:SbcC/MukB-like Walker B domain-containing protein [Runella slithyformis]|uniref:SMC domain protein n=1 Tax=Runella slithyformis (strain ATCC 29530 / DSM 19594 / LMG 11500 / NCIMB 11436 / LSU 4) TaxID=761193 RepID=A0A7U3ZG32_RUNSL|nr:SMC family ATPase [Runella slithyformis]AEI46535.1 SMC domain protein [Runella slithyformis DSM 19594]
MIPVKLILQGIQSYREKQEIDFSQLTAAGLFGIFGKVGSGKSTVLEAITFVLYGDTERLNNRENRSYNLMNLRSDRLYIDLVFRTGHNPTTYRFVAEGKRSGKHFDQVKIDRKAYQWMPELNDWSPIAAENPAEKIIGLSYENFKRTVIIPQGRFQEFIELRDADRTRMMKELFQLERFELSDRVKRLMNRTENELQHIDGQRKSLGDVTPEVYAQTKTDLQNAQTLLKQGKEQLTRKQNEEKAIEALMKLFNRLLEIEEEIKKAEAQTELFQQRRQRLQQFEQCQLSFKPLFDRKQDIATYIRRDTEKQEVLQKAFDTLQDTLTKNQYALDELRPAHEKCSQSLVEIDDMKTIITLKKAETERNTLQKRIEDGKEKFRLRQGALKDRKTSYGKLKENKAALRNQLPDVTVLLEIRNWFDRKEGLLKEKEALKTQANDIVKKEKISVDAKSALFTEEILKLLPQISREQSFETIYEQIDIARRQLTQQAEALNPEILHLNTQKALQQYAGALQDGEPCPLCGAEHHPHTLTADTDYNALIRQLQQRQEQLKTTAAHTLGQLERQFSKVEKDLALVQSQKQEVKKYWDTKAEEIRAHEALFKWENADATDRKPVDLALEQAKSLQGTLNEVEKQLETEEKGIQQDEIELKEKYEKPIEKFGQEIASLDGTIQQATRQLKVLRLEEYSNADVPTLENRAQKREEELKSLIQQFERLDITVRKQRDEIGPLRGEIAGLKTNIANHQIDLKKITDEIRSLLHANQLASEESVAEILGWKLDAVREREVIADFDRNLFALRKERDDLQHTTKDQKLDPELYAALLKEIELLEQSIEKWTGELGRLTDTEQKQARQLQQQAELLAQKAALELRQTDLKTLEKLFKGSGFVNYVSSVYLQNLCNQANARFHRMTRQQLQLEINESNNFQVRDLLNDGKTRALNTLSGGQKFQAALSLALALADNVNSQITSQENFFFLDEGFGSLDRESLQTVFDTLKSLRKENRVVGVISHVEEMQQEIDRYLHITNDEERGSFVRLF